jgi:hypothetical protein
MNEDRLPPIVHLDEGMFERERHARLLLLHEGLLARGHDSRVVCQEGSALHQQLDKIALPHYAMRWLGRHDFFAARRLGGLAKREGAILHAHTAATCTLAAWARRFGEPASVVASVHPSAPGFPHRVSRGDVHLVDTEPAAHTLAALGVEVGRIVVVPQGIDSTGLQEIEPDHAWRASLELQTGELLVGTLVANEDEHDPTAVVLAAEMWRAQSGSGRLALLGDDEPGIDLLPRIAAVDIFVGCARAHATGIEILEAMAMGRPVIAIRGGAADAWIESGRSGELVALEDPRTLPHILADRIGQLQRSAARRQALGHAARQRATRFDSMRTLDLTVAAYHHSIGAR